MSWRKHQQPIDTAPVMAREHRWMAERYEELVAGGLNWDPPTLESANEPECTVDGQQMIMLSANNIIIC